MKEILNTLPTPLELILDPISLIVLGMYGILMIWEALAPARKLPSIKYWKLKGIIAFIIFFYLSSYLQGVHSVRNFRKLSKKSGKSQEKWP